MYNFVRIVQPHEASAVEIGSQPAGFLRRVQKTGSLCEYPCGVRDHSMDLFQLCGETCRHSWFGVTY
jgi:hypothetical protein